METARSRFEWLAWWPNSVGPSMAGEISHASLIFINNFNARGRQKNLNKKKLQSKFSQLNFFIECETAKR